MKDKKIGIFDSGVGGLTVLKELQANLPKESFLYVGDTKNLPYGTKTKDELLKITAKIFDFYKLQNVKAVVMACNTTSAVVWQELKDNYNFPIYPISQTVCKYINQTNLEKIGVFATLATVNSQVYQKNLNANVCAISPIEWVDIVEANSYNLDSSKELIKKYALMMKDFAPEKIILGCTHYPYLIEELSQYFNKNDLINPAKIFAQTILADLQKRQLLTDAKNVENEIFVTDNIDRFLENAERFYEIKEDVQLLEM